MKSKDPKFKRAAWLFLGGSVMLLAVCALILTFSSQIGRWVVSWWTPEEDPSIVSVIYYDPHYSEDQWARYREKDRGLYYTYGNETVMLDDSTMHLFPGHTDFFADYFRILLEGDCEAYNALFAPEYFLRHEKQNELFPQLVYDIGVTYLGEEQQDGVRTEDYLVSYKLFLNNGYLRRDMASDASRPQTMKLKIEGEKVIIYDIQ